eukprot:5690_1
MTGEDFNGCTTADDITQLFDTITKIIGTKVYKCLEKIRNKRRKNNKDNTTNLYSKNYDLLLDKYKKATNTITLQEREITKLKQNNSALRKQNVDLNKECKELKMELEDVQNKYNKLVQQNNDYKTW